MIWNAKIIKHRNKIRIAVEFEKDQELNKKDKIIEGCKMEPGKKGVASSRYS